MSEAIRLKGLLSFTELQVLKAIHQEINGRESAGIVVSKLCDHIHTTRSVAVNVLSKLEFANILTTKSMGMKGLHVSVINQEVFNEICR